MTTRSNSLSPRRNKILKALRDAGGALQIREIVDETGLDYDNARSALSEMTTMGLLVRIHRGVYDLPERAVLQAEPSALEPITKILLNQQILKVLLNIVITNKALMETLLLGQQEIIKALGSLRAKSPEEEEAIGHLERVFADRVEWHFDIAAQKVVEQYTKLPPEVFDVLLAPLAREIDDETAPTRRRSLAPRKNAPKNRR